jgi:hypothetical protein
MNLAMKRTSKKLPPRELMKLLTPSLSKKMKRLRLLISLQRNKVFSSDTPMMEL